MLPVDFQNHDSDCHVELFDLYYDDGNEIFSLDPWLRKQVQVVNVCYFLGSSVVVVDVVYVEDYFLLLVLHLVQQNSTSRGFLLICVGAQSDDDLEIMEVNLKVRD